MRSHQVVVNWKQTAAVFGTAFSILAADTTGTAAGGAEQEREPDSAGVYIARPQLAVESSIDEVELPRYNPLLAGALSALVPGAGHVYCSTREVRKRRVARMVKGGLFLATSGVAAGVMANRAYNYGVWRDIVADTLDRRREWDSVRDAESDSATKAIYAAGYDKTTLNWEIARHKRREARYVMWQAIGWNCGIYIYNICDAVGASRYFLTDAPKNPVLAAWLSAVPALGLGQFYNGSVGKAGLIWMTQTMLLAMAFNYNRLMVDCIQQRDMFADSTNWRFEYRNEPVSDADGSSTFDAGWENRYNDAFRNRNLYLWYAIFFYFYGIFDAAVDAHLHDYRVKV
ncbi:MAG: hypothetical protein GF418_14950, partial [Chitinivibrionales bacterium]|nr:hypothetical protein [Chitinivibrionales bacterium]MBD3396918.1 hypothetical protein [Chitinivibrionales bacterium]